MTGNVSTSNYVWRYGSSPQTRAAISQRSKLFGYAKGATQFQLMGAVSEFSWTESRSAEPVRGIGFGDMIAEMVPGLTDPLELTINKTLLYTVTIQQMVGYSHGIDGLVRSLRHHKWPFDIKHELVFSELASNPQDPLGVAQTATINPPAISEPIYTPRALLTFYEGCWMTSYGVSYSSDSAIVAENSAVVCTDIIDGTSQYGEYIDSGLAPVSANGAPGKGYSLRFANNSNANVQTGLV